MTTELKNTAKPKEIRNALKKIEDKKKRDKGKGNISNFFGINPNEIDGLEFQKKARSEWQ